MMWSRIRSFFGRDAPFTPSDFTHGCSRIGEAYFEPRADFGWPAGWNGWGCSRRLELLFEPSPQGYWWAVVPPQDWPDDPEIRAEIFKHWDDQVGDCRQELAFVGLTVEGTTLRADLNACLLTDSELELGPHGWQQFIDPFSGWALD